jgi:hypothetical protein
MVAIPARLGGLAGEKIFCLATGFGGNLVDRAALPPERFAECFKTCHGLLPIAWRRASYSPR